MGAALSPSTRLVSIDLLRGITVAGMILVNAAGSWGLVYDALAHAEWDGLAFADLVFPSFVFVMGVSIAVALGSALETGRSRGDLAGKVLRRTLILLGLGLLLNAFPYFDLEALRIPGVLQRIALVYCAAALVMLYLPGAGHQAVLAVALVLFSEGLLQLVPVPGVGAGVHTPTGNLGAWLDRTVFGDHLFRPGWDPEGLLGTLPAISSALVGVLAGRWLREGSDPRRQVSGLLASGGLLGAGGWLLARWVPLNKALWSASFVLATSGIGLASLGLLHEVADERGATRLGLPFLWLGRNAIAIYVLSSLTGNLLLRVAVPNLDGGAVALQGRLFAPLTDLAPTPELASLGFALVVLAVWTVVAGLFHRFGFFVRI